MKKNEKRKELAIIIIMMMFFNWVFDASYTISFSLFFFLTQFLSSSSFLIIDVVIRSKREKRKARYSPSMSVFLIRFWSIICPFWDVGLFERSLWVYRWYCSQNKDNRCACISDRREKKERKITRISDSHFFFPFSIYNAIRSIRCTKFSYCLSL
jgi:hypothetical protein